MRNPDFTRALNALRESDEVEMTSTDVEQFVETARQLPGWDDGPRHAPKPVLFAL